MHFIELSEKVASRINSQSQPLQEQIVPKNSLDSLWKPEFIHDSFLLNTLHVMLIYKFTLFLCSEHWEESHVWGHEWVFLPNTVNNFFFLII